MKRFAIYLTFGGGILVVFILMLSLFFFESNRNKSNNNAIPTPILITPAITNGLTIVSTSPTDQDINVPLDQKININFDKFISTSDLKIELVPKTQFTTAVSGTSLTISPESLKPNLTYTIYVTPKNQLPLSFSFSTVNDSSQPANDIGAEASYQNAKNLHPDAFLAGSTPYSSSTFSVQSKYIATPSHFAFTITIIGQTGRNDFIIWARSLGLTDAQLSTLDITYN